MLSNEPAGAEADDASLVGRIVRGRDDEAFAEIVRRHGPMVLGVCRRVLRNQQDAEDAFQATFLVLAMQARTIKNARMLGSWLWGVARHTAIRVQSNDQRRREAEQQRLETPSMQPNPPSADPETLAILDGELDRLADRHRAPVLMCYVEGKTNREAARLLGWPDGTVATRLRKARHLLRKRLVRRGIGTDPEKMGGLVGPAIVPVTLAATTIKAAGATVGGAAASTHSLAIAKGVVKVMAYGKAKTAVVGALAFLLVTGSGVGVSYYVMRDTSSIATSTTPPPMALTGPGAPRFTWQEAPPAQPATRAVPYDGPPVTGDARTPDGAPVVHGQVYLAEGERMVFLTAGQGGTRLAGTTDGNGHFQIRPNQKPKAVVIKTDLGIGYADVDEKQSTASVVVQAWGRVEGVAYIGAKPVSRGMVECLQMAGRAYFWTTTQAATDESGRFVFAQVPPGRVQLNLTPAQDFGGRAYRYDISPGSTANVRVGGQGRVVTGNLSPVPAGAAPTPLVLRLLPPGSEALQSAKTTEERNAIQSQAARSPEYQSYLKNPDQQFQLLLPKDGVFRFADVPPGFYELSTSFALNNQSRNIAGTVHRYLTIPGGTVDDPFDLGTIAVDPGRRVQMGPMDTGNFLQVGSTVPDLAGTDLSGRALRVSQFRGKYLLLSIWRGEPYTWRDIVKTVALSDRMRGNAEFAMLTFYTGSAEALPAEKASMHWPLIGLGKSAGGTVSSGYLDSGEIILLIDPQGRLMANNLDPQRAYYAVDRIFSRTAIENPSGVHIDVTHAPPARGTGDEIPAPPVPAGFRNVAADAAFDVIDSTTIRSIGLLHDGKLLKNDDDDAHVFCFRMGTFEGRIRIDLGKAVSIERVITHSRHKTDRGPQVYTLYGSAGPADVAPGIGTDPASCGWSKIATVDTRPQDGPPGGSYTVNVSNSSGSLGKYRYLLLVSFPTEVVDPYGHTFFGEIEVISKQ